MTEDELKKFAAAVSMGFSKTGGALSSGIFGGINAYHPKPDFNLYIDKSEKGFRWNIKGKNHEIVGASSEAFDSKQGALNNFKLLGEMIAEYCAKEKL